MIVNIHQLVIRYEGSKSRVCQTIFLLTKLHISDPEAITLMSWWESLRLANVHIKKDHLKINLDPPITFTEKVTCYHH